MLMKPYEFSRQKRLLTPGDFRKVFDNVLAKSGCPEILLLCRQQDPSLPAGRIGFIIAKKNVKHAAQRNRIKRIFRETFRQLPSQMQNIDIVVMGKKGADKLSNEQLHELAAKLLKKSAKRVQGNLEQLSKKGA